VKTWIQPFAPSERELTGWRKELKPGLHIPWIKKLVIKITGAMKQQNNNWLCLPFSGIISFKNYS
jgi:hypothetical protein